MSSTITLRGILKPHKVSLETSIFIQTKLFSMKLQAYSNIIELGVGIKAGLGKTGCGSGELVCVHIMKPHIEITCMLS